MSKILSSEVAQKVQLYSEGTNVWIEDEDEAWISVSVVSKEESTTGIKITLENETGRTYNIEFAYALLEKYKGENLPPLKNPVRSDVVDDLTSLNYLNEPSVLHTIRTRYFNRNIYTYSGIVLIAMNPFFKVQLYEPETIQAYSGNRRGDLEPHLFAIAEDAYRCMVKENINQTVVVSGESGAGKTVSATHIMRYFATADDKEKGNTESQGMTEVEKQIMATNPIMEAFGNAKTSRNNNSSRFGKYIEIQFDKGHNIVGAKIRTYLLERPRVVFQPQTERNYHIFYQLCSGMQSSKRDELGIEEWNRFHYLNQSGVGVIPSVDDAEEFNLTEKSLSMIGISAETQMQIFSILSALLHIGNIEIGGRTDATVTDSQPALQKATKLLGVKITEFKKWLLKRQIVTRSDKIIKNLNPVQAVVIRDSVAKFIYASLFDWLVKVINDSLSCNDESNVCAFIGVLDIYGFEHFKKNSFEQFCINYANEKLQQQFNQHVFKLEQEEYIKEQIQWKFIDFSDNQPCIEMIETKFGILSLLDEESRMPSGTDQGFCDKLISSFSKPAYKAFFKKPRFSNSSFTICHYAHDVEYDSEGFLDKNKDTVPDEILSLLQQASCSFLVDILRTADENTTPETKPAPVKKVGMATNKKPSLGSIFKLSLIRLMETINNTNVHYIRCIKPNEGKVAWGFEPQMVLSQLRACGVLETIRISCAGYPSRWTFTDFRDRFYILTNPQHWSSNEPSEIKKLCQMILDTFIKDTDRYQIGLTKIFFRAGQLAFLEMARKQRLDKCAITIQKHVKRYLVRRDYLCTLVLVSRLQRLAKQKLGAKKLISIRQNIAATKIQSQWRRYIQRKHYLRQCAFIIRLQAVSRTYITLKFFAHSRQSISAVRIQSLLRGWLKQRQHRAELQLVQQQKHQKLISSHQLKIGHSADQHSNPMESQIQALAPKAFPHTKNTKSDHNYYPEHNRMQAVDITRLSDKSDHRRESVSKLKVTEILSDDLNEVSIVDEDVILLKNEIMILKTQLSQMMKETPTRNSFATFHSGLLPKSGKSATHNKYKGSSRIAFVEVSQMAPKHMDESKINAKNPAGSIKELLQNSVALEDEICGSLIRSLKFILPELTKLPARDEVVFPAHIVGECAAQMWRHGYLSKAENLLIVFSASIQDYCSSFVAEDTIVPCSYWLSSVHELLSLVSCFEQELESEIRYFEGPTRWQEYEKSISNVKQQLGSLLMQIYWHFLHEIEEIFSSLTIPAIIECQSLPGFITGASFKFFDESKLTPLDELLNLLDRIHCSLKTYYVKNSIIEQIFNEIMKLINTIVFNNLIRRKNFNSWKRAMQIRHNASRLEEWCKLHHITDAINNLEHLIQATKVLQLKKTTMEDYRIICEVCWLLNPAQIQNLLQGYIVAEYEDPLSNDILKAATLDARQADTLTLDLVHTQDRGWHQPELYNVAINLYIPNYLELPTVQSIFALLNHLKKQKPQNIHHYI